MRISKLSNRRRPSRPKLAGAQKTRPHHKQITFILRGKTFTVDTGVRQLIHRLNSFPGVETRYSCQGTYGRNHAYALFDGPGAPALLKPLAAAILGEAETWFWKHDHRSSGSLGMSITLEVSSCGYVLRWHPKDYRLLLRLTGSVAKMLKPSRTARRNSLS